MNSKKKKKLFNLEILINKEGKVSFKDVNKDVIEIISRLNPENEEIKRRLKLIKKKKST